MTVTLELTADIEEAIDRKAQRQGITASEYLHRMVERAARPQRPAKPRRTEGPTQARSKTPAEFLAELDALDIPQGYGDPAIDSPELARELRERFSRPNREAH